MIAFWTKLAQHPAHPAELCRGHNAGDLLSCHFGLYTEIAPLLGVIVQNDVSHNTGAEIGDRDEFYMAVSQLFPTDHFTSPLLIRSHSRPTMRVNRGSSRGRLPVGVRLPIPAKLLEIS